MSAPQAGRAVGKRSDRSRARVHATLEDSRFAACDSDLDLDGLVGAAEVDPRDRCKQQACVNRYLTADLAAQRIGVG